ncbi:MAG: YfhO family protein [Planctomycetia bacterium]|nr:YfhO family protein [Planctomycetia bacterium]
MKLPHPLLILTLLGLLFFGDLVLHPGQVLYSDYSDLFPLHLPSKVFLVRSWQETGELPLWCPYYFSGLPFVHDVQVSAFYPPHWPLLLLPADDQLTARLGAALSWLIVLHCLAAGWCMYAYARGNGLERWPAFAAGLGYMFAGKWLIHVLHAGHYNMIPLAWLPLAVLWLEQAIRRVNWQRAVWAGAAFAFIITGAYPYVTLYAGLFLALWAVGPALERAGFFDDSEPRSPARISRAFGLWLGMGACCAGTGVLLGAVQLLPSLEGSGQATRSLGVSGSAGLFRSALESLLTLTGRATVNNQGWWDYEGGIGLLWLSLAVCAPVLRRGPPRWQAAVALLIIAYAAGGAVLLQGLPGFRFFRLPSRSLLLLAFPAAYLAAQTLQRLLAEGGRTDDEQRRCLGAVVRLLVIVLILQGGNTLTSVLAGKEPRLSVYWLVLPFTLACAWALFRAKWPPTRLAAAWLALLLVDLWSLTGWLAVVKPTAEIFAPSACVRQLTELTRAQPGRIVDRGTIERGDTPLWQGLPAVLQLESTGGFNPTDVLRYKEYVRFITDSAEPLQPPQGPFTFPVLETFPIRNKPLLDLLGVRYVLQPVGITLDKAGELPLGSDPRWRKVGSDPSPHGYDYSGGGLIALPAYELFENLEVMPRAFVVHEVKPLPDGGPEAVLAALEATDFRRTALLEKSAAHSPADNPPPRLTRIRESRPNRLMVDVAAGVPGQLILGEIWFPGWQATVNGQSALIDRANYLFRSVAVPAEACEVVFTFSPASYAWGQRLSLIGLVVLAGSVLVPGRRATARRSGFPA